jgi:hypothetical protein
MRSFLARMFNHLFVSTKVVACLRDAIKGNLSTLGTRGGKPTPFDTDEVAAIFRILVGHFDIHDVTFKQYLRPADRLGHVIGQVKWVKVSDQHVGTCS